MESIQHISVLMILLMLLNTTTSNKSNARPVYEVINEQARADDRIRISNSPSVLPYGNPLAGNSKQNARIHISNQQAMFNAERVRQHRAQLQKLAKNPQPFDSYMKAYHDSQDNHQLVVEQQQATLREIITKTPPTRAQTNPVPKQKVQNNPVPKQKVLSNPPRKRIQNNPEEISRIVENTNQKENSERRNLPVRKTTDGTPIRGMKFRNQRSYGPVEYQKYLYPQMHKLLNYVAPGPNYDQGVTIKPNGNIGLAQQDIKSSKLYTEAVPSDTKYIYPKQYSQMLNYKTEEQLENTDTYKPAQDLLSEYNLQNSAKDANDIPIDFYFYLKNPTQEISQPYDRLKYTQEGNTYASGYMSDYAKDHIPITEEVDDIEDPYKQKGLKYVAEPETTPLPQETTTIKTNHYYKIEVASQTVSTEHKPKKVKEELYYKQEETPTYESSRYPSHYAQETSDTSERYLHHNAQHVGVQHLTEDGTGVSAFGDDDLQYAANYKFGYRVDDHKTGNYFGHQEAKSGRTTSGHYHVLLPDGRMQKVDYSAGPEGFHADISYDHLQ